MECSSVVCDEEENTLTEEQKEAIEFSDTTDGAQTDEAQEAIDEMNEAHDLDRTLVSNKYPISFVMQ